MAKYNEFENDDYLLTTNLLGMTNFSELIKSVPVQEITTNNSTNCIKNKVD